MLLAKITPRDAEYPALLREVPWRPLFLFRVGAPIPNKPTVAIVGTREPTARGRELARRIGAELARRGCAVATGFAQGIDEMVAYGVKEAGGHIIAVLPYIYESEHELNKALLKLSGYRNLTGVSIHLTKRDDRVKSWLVERDLLIGGISAAVVVPETRLRTSGWGTAYTVKFAVNMRRKIFIVKSQTDDSGVIEGFKELVKMGAIPVPDVDKLIEEACRETFQRAKA